MTNLLPVITAPVSVGAVTGFPLLADPYTNITPFTYRDGLTYLEVQERLREWLTKTLSPAIDANMLALQGAWDTEARAIIDVVNAALTTSNNDIVDVTTQVNTLVNSLNADLAAAANNAAASATSAAAAQTVLNTINTTVATLAKKQNRVIDAGDYGAVADGATDVIGPINAALAALAGPGVVRVAPGDYLANNANPIILAAGQSLFCPGGRARIVRQNAGAYGIVRSVGASTTHLTNLSADAVAGATSLTVVSSVGVSVGDYVQVYSSAMFGTNSNNTKGEAVYVVAIPDATHLTLQGPLRDSYTVAASGGVNALNLQRDITLDGFIFESANPLTDNVPLVNFQNVRNLTVDNCVFRNNAGMGLTIDTCIDFNVDIQASNLVDDAANGRFGYAVNVGGGSENGEVNVIATFVRHAFTTTGAGAGVAGVPRNIRVTGVVRGTPTTAGWDTHADAENVTFDGVKAVGCAIGVQLRSPSTTVEGGVIDDCTVGVFVTANANNARIIDTVISNTRSSASYPSGNAIRIAGTFSPTDVTIDNVTIDGCDHAPIKIDRPDSGAAGVDPVGVRIFNLKAYDGGKVTSGQGVLWIEDQVVISTITMLNTFAANRTAAGQFKWLATKSGAGAVDGVFVGARLQGFLVKGTPFTGFSPTVVNDIKYLDSVTANNVGRGVRKGSNLFYGPRGATVTVTQSANQLALAPIDIDRPCTLKALAAEVTTAGSVGSVVRLGIYTDDGSGWFPYGLVADAGTIDGTVVGAATLTLATPIYLMPGRYWVGAASQGAPTTAPILRGINGTSGADTMPPATGIPADSNTGAAQNAVTAALPNTFTTAYGVTSSTPRVLAQLN